MVYIISICLGLLLFLALFALFRVIQLIYISTQGAFFAGSSPNRIKDLIKLSDLKKGEKAIELGCGDGRVVVALAKAGADVDGIEIDPYYYRKAQKAVKKANLEGQVQLINKNFWDIDFSEYDLIVVYGISYIMKKLEKKIQRELKSGARVVSVHYEMPTWEADEKKGEVWLYRR